MSTTRDVRIAAQYAFGAGRGQRKLFFRIKVQTPMDMGADVGWLSAYPVEKGVIYPPLSFMQPLFKQVLKKPLDGEVVTMTVTFPS